MSELRLYERSLRQSLRDLLDDANAPIAPLINRKRVQEVLARYPVHA